MDDILIGCYVLSGFFFLLSLACEIYMRVR